jgi:hypothetical protein
MNGRFFLYMFGNWIGIGFCMCSIWIESVMDWVKWFVKQKKILLDSIHSPSLKSEPNVITYTLINGFEEVNFIFMFDIVSSSDTTENKKRKKAYIMSVQTNKM